MAMEAPFVRASHVSQRMALRSLQSSRRPLPAGLKDLPVQRQVVPGPHDPQRAVLRAELARGELVLGVEHRLAGVQIRLEGRTLVVLIALLVQDAIEERLERLRLTGI